MEKAFRQQLTGIISRKQHKDKSMTILMLNASPRPNGLISQMLNLMADEARLQGHNVEMMQVCHLQVHPCIGCMSCRSQGTCILPEDDAHHVLGLLRQSDAVVIGSPCYWGNMNGQLKVLFDRLVYGLMEESSRGLPRPLHKGKRAIIVTTSSTPWPFHIWCNQTRGVIRSLREILKWSGITLTGTLQKGGTKQHPELTAKDQKQCIQLIRSL